MKIYNYLFYKSFILAKKSKNFDDIPVLGGMMFVIACVMFNIFTVLLLLEGFDIINHVNFIGEHKWLFASGLLGSLLFYYSYKGRYKRIIKYYEDRKSKMINIHPIIVVIFYYLVSFGLLLLAGLFYNKMWIFAQ